jgi:hypothetical protein
MRLQLVVRRTAAERRRVRRTMSRPPRPARTSENSLPAVGRELNENRPTASGGVSASGAVILVGDSHDASASGDATSRGVGASFVFAVHV